ncbi:hypothetical protein [Tunicatimonas pelagia]|uniref:hypothetical protein n=1 Tax=Tunicatimonas pelagia TaxID=931531 RepID=UPI0026666C7C|nr:hypothetical protein [Tunicatimonas pelagia]WKN42867.1 hypothetical protein P0M28_27910 [Tunicatimonas pelagia]
MNSIESTQSAPAEQDYQLWQRSLPAQVFLNYFYALLRHIAQSDQAYELPKIAHFSERKVIFTEADVASVRRHLINSWNTEYTIRQTAALGDATYQQHALHWTFPQAYYSVEESLKALLRVNGSSGPPSRVLTAAGRLVKQKFYPQPISFYASGEAHHPSVYGLPAGRWSKPTLILAQDKREAQSQLRQFLRTTHRQRSQQVRARVQGNPKTALRSERTGEILRRFNREHWQQLTWRIGNTTVFHLLQRLVISASNREIERFVVADIDTELFHQCLLGIVSYINFVHEAYVTQAVGINTYADWLSELPPYLKNSFASERYEKRAVSVVGQNTAA